MGLVQGPPWQLLFALPLVLLWLLSLPLLVLCTMRFSDWETGSCFSSLWFVLVQVGTGHDWNMIHFSFLGLPPRAPATQTKKKKEKEKRTCTSWLISPLTIFHHVTISAPILNLHKIVNFILINDQNTHARTNFVINNFMFLKFEDKWQNRYFTFI